VVRRNLIAQVTRAGETTGDNVEHYISGGEVWKKRNSQWLVHSYSGTLIK